MGGTRNVFLCCRRRQHTSSKDKVVSLHSHEGKDTENSESTQSTELDDEIDKIDYAVGFNLNACKKFGIHDVDEAASDCSREESDEFRVLRVSNLSGHVTLYVAGGKHKKPVQYDQAREFPRAEEQPTLAPKCPFCVGNEAATPPDILTFGPDGQELPLGQTRSGGWLVRVFPNIFPMLICPFEFYGKQHLDALDKIPHSIVARGVHANKKVKRDKANPVCEQVDAEGVSEVLVESPVHNALLALQEPRNITVLLRAIVKRTKALSKMKWAKQLLIFKQYGPLSGGSLVHPHTQIVSLPLLPPALQSRLEYHLQFYHKHCRCVTCWAYVESFLMESSTPKDTLMPTKTISSMSIPGIVDQEQQSPLSAKSRQLTPLSRNDSIISIQPKNSRLVYISTYFVVSVPYSSGSQYSMTIAPRRHSPNFYDITPEEMDDLAEVLALLAQAIYHGLDDPNYNIYIRTAPSPIDLQLGDKAVTKSELESAFHWIVEIRPRFPADVGGFEIASGIRVVSGLPEDHAAEIRCWVNERLMKGAAPVESHTAPEEIRRRLVRLSSKQRVEVPSELKGARAVDIMSLESEASPPPPPPPPPPPAHPASRPMAHRRCSNSS